MRKNGHRIVLKPKLDVEHTSWMINIYSIVLAVGSFEIPKQSNQVSIKKEWSSETFNFPAPKNVKVNTTVSFTAYDPNNITNSIDPYPAQLLIYNPRPGHCGHFLLPVVVSISLRFHAGKNVRPCPLRISAPFKIVFHYSGTVVERYHHCDR